MTTGQTLQPVVALAPSPSFRTARRGLMLWDNTAALQQRSDAQRPGRCEST
jgi:hypothetical protein